VVTRGEALNQERIHCLYWLCESFDFFRFWC